MPQDYISKDAREFTDYLENTLIPDLKESGHVNTAEDFDKAVVIICALLEILDDYKAD